MSLLKIKQLIKANYTSGGCVVSMISLLLSDFVENPESQDL